MLQGASVRFFMFSSGDDWCRVLQCVAVWYNVLQCGTMCCRVLQCAFSRSPQEMIGSCCFTRCIGSLSLMRCVAVCCSVVQCGAVWCSVVQSEAQGCRVLR